MCFISTCAWGLLISSVCGCSISFYVNEVSLIFVLSVASLRISGLLRSKAHISMNSGQRTRTLDDTTAASDPGQVKLSHKKLRKLRPDLYGVSGIWNSVLIRLGVRWPQRVYIEEQLQCGDSRAAVVVSLNPLLIAAYTDELDCVAMLRFPDKFVHEYDLSVGTRLLTVNCYGRSADYAPDLILGPQMIERWTEFHPLIAEFLTDDDGRVQARKKHIGEDEWRRAAAMGTEYAKLHPGVARDGRPVYSTVPASL